MIYRKDGGALLARHCGETLRIEPWGENSFRVRATMRSHFTDYAWALTENVTACPAAIEIFEAKDWKGDPFIPGGNPVAVITNGRAKAVVNFAGVISFYRDDVLVLREYFRYYGGTISRGSRCLKVANREWKGVIGGTDYALTVRFDANEGEKLFGMGQYQQPYLDLKGTTLELVQRNSQNSVPFLVSSLGYGLLWNNPAVGRVTFGKNLTEWTAQSTKDMDYWFTVQDG
ncbi:MAG: family 31 glucosidase, partial [Lachnospiraceae bacterium]|nr:family 31 glucosidase [Lachnospiraceae bacterium]